MRWHVRRLRGGYVLWLVLPLLVAAFPAIGRAETLRYPLSAVVANDGTVFVADRNLPGIWQLRDGKWQVYFQASKKYRTPLNAVRCVALDAEGRLLAGDSATRDVYRFDAEQRPVPLTGGGIGIPMDIAVRKDGTLLVSDLELHRIWKVPAEGGEAEPWAEVRGPRGLALDEEDALWVLTRGDNQVVRITPDGKQQAVVGGQPMPFPQDIAIGQDGAAYISDNYARSIWKLASGEEPSKWLSGEPLVNPAGLTWKGTSLVIVDSRVPALFEVSPDKQLRRLGP